MNNRYEKIKPQEERRRTVKYGYDDNVPNEFMNDILRCGSVYGTLSGADRNRNFLLTSLNINDKIILTV